MSWLGLRREAIRSFAQVPHRLTWGARKAAELWRKRGPFASSHAPDLLSPGEDLKAVLPGTVGRDRLVLKAKNTEEFMYYTSDND